MSKISASIFDFGYCLSPIALAALSQNPEFLFLLYFLRLALIGGGGRSVSRLGLVWAGTRVGKSRLHIDVRLFAKIRKVCPQSRLKLFVINRFLNAIFYLFQGCDSRLRVFIHLQNHETLFRADHV